MPPLPSELTNYDPNAKTDVTLYSQLLKLAIYCLAHSLYLGPRLLCMSGVAALEKCSSTKMFYCISKKQYLGIQAKFIDS